MLEPSEGSGRSPVIALVGPTASGKTAVGLLLAEALGTDIIGVDSRQVYRHLDIGTAKPTPEQRRRVSHHLIDLVEPDHPFSVGRYRKEVYLLLPDLEAAGKIPLFVGGTGLYLKAVLEGLCPAPEANPDVREWLTRVAGFVSPVQAVPESGKPVMGLHQLLQRIDPAAAERLHPNDRYRLLRALEVYYLGGETLSSLQARHRFAEHHFHTVTFGLNPSRAELDNRIRRRLDEMLRKGFLHEVSRILDRAFSPRLPALRAVGYPQLIAHLRGECSLDSARENILKATRQYAKRQMTWFGAVPDIIWLNSDPGRRPASLAQEILTTLRRMRIS